MFKVRNWIGVISTPVFVTSVGCAVTHQPVANNQRGLTTDRMMAVGKTLERQGHLAQARFAYQQVVAVQPQNANAQQSLETLVALENQQFQLRYGQQYVASNQFVVPQQQMISMPQMVQSSMPQSAPMAATSMTMQQIRAASVNTMQTTNGAILAPLAQIRVQSMTMRPIQMAPAQSQMTPIQVPTGAMQSQTMMVQSPVVTMQTPMTMVQSNMQIMSAPMTTVQAAPVMQPPALPNAPLPTQMANMPARNLIQQVGTIPEVSQPVFTGEQPPFIPPSPSISTPDVPATQAAPARQRVSRVRTPSRTTITAAASIVMPQLSDVPVGIMSSVSVAESNEPIELPSPIEVPSPIETLAAPAVVSAVVDKQEVESQPAPEPIRTVSNEIITTPKEEPAVLPCDAEFQRPILMTPEDPYGNSGQFDPIDERGTEVAIDLNQISNLSLRHYFGDFSAAVVEELKTNRDEYLDSICRLAVDSTKQRELRTRAILLLGAIGPEAASAVPDLRRSMHHTRDRYLQADIAEAILKIQGSDPDAVEILIDCLHQQDRGLKLIAAFSLRNAAPSEIPRAIEGLERWVATDDLKLKRMIYLTLGEFGPAAARAIPYLEAGLQNPDQSTRDIAAASLAVISPERQTTSPSGSTPDWF